MSNWNKHLPHRRALPAARARLFCLPYAGGSAGAFCGWTARLAPSIDLCAVELPGRGRRFNEPPLRRVDAHVEALLPVVRALSDKPFAIFGHSLGARLAFALAHRLHRERGPRPVGLILSGHGLRDREEPPLHALAAAVLVDRLRQYEGTPPEILDNAELLEIVLPSLRADFETAELHTYDPDARVDVPILALGGRRDPDVPEESLAAWGERTSAGIELRMFEGKHFFLVEAETTVLAAIQTFIEGALV